MLVLPRLIIACLKYFANCPCPRCLIPKELIFNLGNVTDHRYRTEFERKDDNEVHAAIAKARKQVFRGTGLKSEAVEQALRPQSLTPSRVRAQLSAWLDSGSLTSFRRVHCQRSSARILTSAYTISLFQICSTSLILGCGRVSLPTFSGLCMSAVANL